MILRLENNEKINYQKAKTEQQKYDYHCGLGQEMREAVALQTSKQLQGHRTNRRPGGASRMG